MTDDHIDPEDRQLAKDLAGLAAVQAAIRDIDAAIGALAADPLSQVQAQRLCALLVSAELRRARLALRQLEAKPMRRPPLVGAADGGAVPLPESGRAQVIWLQPRDAGKTPPP